MPVHSQGLGTPCLSHAENAPSTPRISSKIDEYLSRLISPEGILEEVRFIADELGVRAESPLLPTPPPAPAHAVEQMRLAEEQRALEFTAQ
ncbi:Cuticle protein AM1199 [Portunus trituberculatus]|uniref:Cuticle protein AM1199 n=1 Tax=Portunus trituberculatus TaxID=210409 RepID=A0A5B7D2E8_PORTR|nr:Cuticle protein AM1199 [Portunus trituberculatus]